MPSGRRALAVVLAALVMGALTGSTRSAAEPFHPKLVAGNAAHSGVVWPLPTPRLDQGSRGTCTVFATAQAINMLPGKRITQAVADRISDAAQAIPVSAVYGPDDAIRDTLARHGYPASYRVLNGVDATLAALRAGPVRLTVPFFVGMYQTGPDGRWRPTGAFTWLGHGVVAYGMVGDRVLLLNQWGTWWGINGTAWMTVADLRSLFAGYPQFAGAQVWTRA